MPADTTLPQISGKHGNGNAPYPCHQRTTPPGGNGFIDYGYCRTSLDSSEGVRDPRCPNDCKHKAPADVVEGFAVRFATRGAVSAAEWVRAEKGVQA